MAAEDVVFLMGDSMGLQTIIADWNGTLIADRNELPILKQLAVDIARSQFPLHPLKIAGIIGAGRRINRIYAERKRSGDTDYVGRMYEVFNKSILEGTPMSVIKDSVEQYAAGAVQERLDCRILNVLRKYHDMKKGCGILSAGYAYGIDCILKASGFRDSFDFLLADEIVQMQGRARELMLKIYRNKGRYLQDLLESREIDPGQTAYIGDTQDDEDCFKLVRYPVVSFFAPDDFKRHCFETHSAFIPESEEDLLAFFERIDK
jgi:phosphoserine phosphatase